MSIALARVLHAFVILHVFWFYKCTRACLALLYVLVFFSLFFMTHELILIKSLIFMHAQHTCCLRNVHCGKYRIIFWHLVKFIKSNYNNTFFVLICLHFYLIFVTIYLFFKNYILQMYAICNVLFFYWIWNFTKLLLLF